MNPDLSLWYRILAPRPVVLISTVNSKGISNAAPFSFVMPCSVKPPLIEFASSPNHHTVKNIAKNGDFVVNIPGPGIVKELWACAGKLPEGVSEIDESGLTAIKSARVKAPGIKECSARFECKLHDKFKTGDHVTIVGEVVNVYVKGSYFKAGTYQVKQANPLMHIGGKKFALAGKIVQVK